MPRAPRARRRLPPAPVSRGPMPVLGRVRIWPPRPPPPALPAGALPPPPAGATAPGQTVSPMAMALPALPPLLTSSMETAPPSADAVATPALPALAVSVCCKRSSSVWSDSADQLFRLLRRLLLLLLLLFRLLLLFLL